MALITTEFSAQASAVTTHPAAPARRGGVLADTLVESLTGSIQAGRLAPGARLPTEGAMCAEHGVSRTVVREAISRLKAAGLVQTRHGIGTFVLGPGDSAVFRVRPEEMGTLNEVISVLELRIAVETEAAALAAQRATPQSLERMRAALQEFDDTLAQGRDAVPADFRFHLEIARATGNPHFEGLLGALGTGAIPRARLSNADADPVQRQAYLRRVNEEHQNVLQAIARGGAEGARAAMRIHLANSRARRQRAAVLSHA